MVTEGTPARYDPPMKQRTRLLALAVAGLVVLAGCHRGGNNATTLSPSQLLQKANQQLCGVESDVLGVVGDVSSGTITSTADVSTKLGDLKTQLDDAAASFKKHGFGNLSKKVTTLSSAVGKLESAITAGSTPGIVAAATTIANAVAALPGCPGATPSA
jgi:ABC-type glycerol-3-phosphate transport system substrate-binding protein